MDIIVVGSMALDSVKTPDREVEEVLGGSATYFSCSACLFSKVGIISVVGKDFPKEHVKMLKSRNIDVSGLEIHDGQTFRWRGHYMENLNEAKTVSVCPNVMDCFMPKLLPKYRKADYVFLANIGPETQMEVLRQVESPQLVVCDTMNLWIDTKLPILLELIKKVDVLVLNDGEARMLAKKQNTIAAVNVLLEMGPKAVIVKKGEHGAIFATKESFFAVPAYPLQKVCDPTGAGDSFGGGFLGHIAATGDITVRNLRKAVVYGTVVASFTVEDFSTRKLEKINRADVEERFKKLEKIVKF